MTARSVSFAFLCEGSSGEGTRNPKEILQKALLSASETSGRRLKKEKNSFNHHRRVLLQRLDPFGAVRDLPSWQCLERDIKRALEQLENQNCKGNNPCSVTFPLGPSGNRKTPGPMPSARWVGHRSGGRGTGRRAPCATYP